MLTIRASRPGDDRGVARQRRVPQVLAEEQLAPGVDGVEGDAEGPRGVPLAAPVDDARHAGLAVEPAVVGGALEADDELLPGQDRDLALEQHAGGGEVEDAGADEAEVARADDLAGGLDAAAKAGARALGVENGRMAVIVRGPYGARPR